MMLLQWQSSHNGEAPPSAVKEYIVEEKEEKETVEEEANNVPANIQIKVCLWCLKRVPKITWFSKLSKTC